MLTTDELRTICAALQYWEEEMCPHGTKAMRGYFATADFTTMKGADVAALRARLDGTEIRYGALDVARDHLQSTRLFESGREAMAHTRDLDRLAAVLIPPRAP